MNIHLEKRRFIECFEAFGKINGSSISQDFDQCSLINASTIDDYFSAVVDFTDWLYGDCDDNRTIAKKFEHRWNRINEIKTKVADFIEGKSYSTFDFTDYYSQHGDYPFETWITWTYHVTYPPRDDGLYYISSECSDNQVFRTKQEDNWDLKCNDDMQEWNST